MLDLESVRLFVLAAEYGNLTRAAETAGTVQPAVSQRLKALETFLGRRLLDRTPRFVRLTEDGKLFLGRARQLLAAHDAAVALDARPPFQVSLAVSDHVLGTSFEHVLRRLRAVLPANVSFRLRLGQSAPMRAAFESGEADFAILRREAGGGDGETLGRDPLQWRAAPGFERPEGDLPIACLPPPCGVRATTLKALDRHGIAWREAFVGGSCLALVAAVRAGVGVAALGRLVGGDLAHCADALGLPPLPDSNIVLLARTAGAAEGAVARSLAASVRELLSRRAAQDVAA